MVIRLRALSERMQTEIADIRNLLQTARDVVLAIRLEVQAARGIHATVVDRFAAIEDRLDILETPPDP